MNDDLKVAFQALNGGRGAVMVGGKWSFSDKDLYLKYKMCRKHNCVKINYDFGKDLFNVEFIKIGKLDMKVVKKLDGLYTDQLRSVFESETGLYLSL